MKSKIFTFLFSFLLLTSSYAADEATTDIPGVTNKWMVLKGFTFQDFVMLATVLLIVVTTFFIIYQLIVMRMQIKLLDKVRETKDPHAILDDGTWLERFSKKFSGLHPLEKEGELIMEDHEYDGIVELKNGMPPWLQAFFIVTVLFGVSYLTYYYVLKIGPDQYQEYQMELDKANKQKEERDKLMAGSIDETNVELSTDETDLAKGKNIFIDNCATCHKEHGEGDSGPNLTDQYWIHGGGIKNVFKTIKIGYVEKGMRSWADVLSPLQIKQVSSYVLSLQGTNPPNAKPPQGELWTGEEVSIDSNSVKTDSLKTDSMVSDVAK